MKLPGIPQLLLVILLFSTLSNGVMAGPDSLRFNGQLSLWSGYNLLAKEGMAGGRFLPELFYQRMIKQKLQLDIDLSANGYGSLLFAKKEAKPGQSGISLYRASVRLSSEQWEIRLGLQKISFGPASMIRPLMWFDGTDPRDPLKITSGVYGLLGRYYSLDNTNFWIWGLLGNEEERGWDIIPTLRFKPEIGGRAQKSLWGGEAAVSYHYRQPGSDTTFMPEQLPYDSFRYTEHRFALDGKWTIGPGIWFETVFKLSPGIPGELYRKEHYLCLGTDYTFGIGNGLYLSTENMLYLGSDSKDKSNTSLNISALSTSYPIGLMDRIMFMCYYAWKPNELYSFIHFQRQYDHLSIHLMAFANPEQVVLLPAMDGNAIYSGKGGILMISYHF